MNPTAIAGFLIVDFSIDLSTGQGIFKQNFPSFENRIWVDFPLLAAEWRYLLHFLIFSVSLSENDCFSTKNPCFFCGNVIKFRLREYAIKSSDFYCFYLKRVRVLSENRRNDRQRGILFRVSHFFLEILAVFQEKMVRHREKMLLSGHFDSFQIHPGKGAALCIHLPMSGQRF